MRTLEGIGQSRFGGGISYTWIITPSGRIFDGHGPDRQGAHTGGRNNVARAICFIGNYENMQPTQAQLNSAAWLLRHARSRGWIRNARLNGGHRNAPGASTLCPGRHAQAQISTINSRAASGGGGTTPPPPPRSWFDMASKQDLRDVVVSALQNTVVKHSDKNIAWHLRSAANQGPSGWSAEDWNAFWNAIVKNSDYNMAWHVRRAAMASPGYYRSYDAVQQNTEILQKLEAISQRLDALESQ